MPRVFTAVAAKDYPAEDITKGATYFYWTPYRGRKRRSATRPRPSQVEPNATKASIYAAVEDLTAFLGRTNEDTLIEDVRELINDCKQAAEDAVQEFEEKADNIEDGFGHETEQSQHQREMGESTQEWADQLDQIDTDEAEVTDILEELSGIDGGPEI